MVMVPKNNEIVKVKSPQNDKIVILATLTSLDFNYVKPCFDLSKFKLQLLTLGQGV